MDESRRGDALGGFSALPAGTVLDRYRIDSVIAAGGFGITYLCRHVTLGKPYALKEHFPRQFAYRDGATMNVRPTDPDTFSWTLDRFLQEGRALASCHHPNVVDVADVFEANQTAYMVLGYEEGRSLKTWLEMLGRAPTQAEIDAILPPLLDALAYVHAQGLLHRDIAPDNIMIRSDGKPCLIDFGSARQAVAERSQMMSALVKHGYSPPEQYSSAGRMQGPWSDIYALGATLYRMVTGKTLPESTDRSIDDAVRPIRETIVEPGAYRAGFLDGIDKALAFHYSKRPQSIAEWRAVLMDDSQMPPAATVPPSQEPTGASTPPDRASSTGAGTSGTSAPAPEPPRGSKNRKALTVLAAILVIGGLSYAISSHQSETRRAAAILKSEDDARAQRDRDAAERSAKERAEKDAQTARDRAAREAEARRQRIDAEQRAEAQRKDAAARAEREREEAERAARARAAIEAARLQAEREAEEARAAEARRKRLEEEQRIAALRAESDRLTREKEEAERAASTHASDLFNRSALPSFNCDTYSAKPIDSAERNPQTDVLCISIAAADADRRLGDVYRQRISGLSSSARRSLLEQQRAWILQRNQACAAGWSDIRNAVRFASIVNCLIRETEIRRRELLR